MNFDKAPGLMEIHGWTKENVLACHSLSRLLVSLEGRILSVCALLIIYYSFGVTEKDIYKSAMLMRTHKLDLEQEDDAAGFAGVVLEHNAETDLINMQQTNSIGRGIEALRLDIGFVNRKATQAPYMPVVKG